MSIKLIWGNENSKKKFKEVKCFKKWTYEKICNIQPWNVVYHTGY